MKRNIISSLLIMLFFAFTAQAKRVQLLEFLPTGKAEIAVVVCPGGSYCWLSKKTEGTEVGRWLAANGIAAYVLYYPTAGWAGFALHSRAIFGGHQYPDQLNALSGALQEVRQKGYKMVGAMGFSAGGHLVVNAAEQLADGIAPDFIAPLYPVVTMTEKCVHRRSRRGLLGEKGWRNKAMRDSLSVERHTDRVRCPVFLMNCKDDPIVDFHNSELLDSALIANHVEHVYYQFATGGHGFGTDKTKTSKEAIGWKDAFLKWLHSIATRKQ